MIYQEFRPQPALSQFVECFWTLESASLPRAFTAERILPDGCVEIVLNFGELFRERRFNGAEVLQPRHFLVGQMTQPILIAPTGSVQLIGIRFQPGGTLPFFRFPMHEITNRITELGAISSELERDLKERTEGSSFLPAKITALESLLAKRASDHEQDSPLLKLIAEVINLDGNVSVETLAKDAGVSMRQVERRFLREVGIGPKLLCRILRFQQVFSAVDRNKSEWANVAVACGYYDQAHLIRDFQQFAGQAPTVLFSNPSALTRAFTRENRMSDSSNHLS